MAEPRDIAYTIEWEPAPGVQGDEHRATWARFEFWVALASASRKSRTR